MADLECCRFALPEDPREAAVVGARVILRDLWTADIDDYARWFSGEREWAEWDAPWEPVQETPDDVRGQMAARLRGARPHPRKALEICLRAGDHIGRVTRYAPKEGDCCHVGIDLFESRTWGQGLGTEGLRLWIGYLAAHGIRVFRCATWEGNARMLSLAVRLGFREVERDVDARFVKGRRWDRVVLELRAESLDEPCSARATSGG